MNEMYKFTRNTLRVDSDNTSVLIPKASIEKFCMWVCPIDISVRDEWVEAYKVEILVKLAHSSATYALCSKQCSTETAAREEGKRIIENLQQEYENSCL